MRWEHSSSVSYKSLGAATMPISTKLQCAHCGSTLKTSKIVLPGAKVRCPKCKGVFDIHASDDHGLIETIPIEGETETLEVAPLSSADLHTGIVKGAMGTRPGATAPVRAQAPTLTATKSLDLVGTQPAFRSGRTVFAAIGVAIAVVAVAAFAWWYVGTVKELDTAGNVAVEAGAAKTETAPEPPSLGMPSEKAAATAKTTLENLSLPPSRTMAPSTAEIGDLVVGISSARLGPLNRSTAQNSLTLGLRITNRSDKPRKYLGWTQPEIKVLLRDRYGNFYNRIPLGPRDELMIKPGETITDRLAFEPTAFGSEVTLDLPVAGSEKSFQFLIPAAFIERTPPPTVASANQPLRLPSPLPLGTSPAAQTAPAAPLPLGTSPAAPTAPEAPSTPEPYDPETDEKVRTKLRGDFNESLAEINRRRLGMSSNESLTFRRRETAKLVKKLAKDNELTEDQVKRIVGRKG